MSYTTHDAAILCRRIVGSKPPDGVGGSTGVRGWMQTERVGLVVDGGAALTWDADSVSTLTHHERFSDILRRFVRLEV